MITWEWDKNQIKKFNIHVEQTDVYETEYSFETDQLSLMPYGETHLIEEGDYDEDDEESHPLEQRFAIGTYYTFTEIRTASIIKFKKILSFLKDDILLLQSPFVGLADVEDFNRLRAAFRIQRSCRRWLWEPETRDGKLGIQMRLLIKNNENLLSQQDDFSSKILRIGEEMIFY